MTKYFCDRCGIESKKLSDIQIPKQKIRYGFETKTIQVCDNCKNEYDNINVKLVDIRFILFDDFLKEEKYFSPEDVRNMTPQEVREKYTAIRKSMEMW